MTNLSKFPTRITRIAFAAALTLGAASAHAQLGLGATVGGAVDATGQAIGGAVNATATAAVDTGITAKVKARLATDAVLTGSNISTSTQNGVTVLTGTVASLEAKTAAERLAASTEGVTKVENRLVISASGSTQGNSAGAGASVNANTSVNAETGLDRAGARIDANLEKAEARTEAAAATTKRVVTDSWVTTKVKSQLLADTLTQGSKIAVRTKGKVVFLSGTASSQAEKDQAIALAKQTEGVKRVNAKKLRVSANVDARVN